MDFLKKHYEKILLGVMLVGLIGVLVFMIFYIASDKSGMEDKRVSYTTPHAKPLTNLDTTIEDNATLRVKTPYNLDFETTNRLLNPMEWQRSLDGSLIPAAKKTGPQMVVVTGITPLYLIISLESISSNELGTRYIIKVERQAATSRAKRAATQRFISPNEKPNDIFGLDSVKGPPEDPELTLKLVDTGEEVKVTKDKPYRHAEGYAADGRYDPERIVFRGKRVNDRLAFGGVDYFVVEVNSNELILMDPSNQKKTSLPFVQ
jgi:hypothetical protein